MKIKKVATDALINANKIQTTPRPRPDSDDLGSFVVILAAIAIRTRLRRICWTKKPEEIRLA